MKQITLIIVLFLSSISFAQNEFENDFDTHISSISYTVNTIEELKSIDWNDLKALFSENDGEKEIQIELELNLKESKNKFEGIISIKGKTKNLDTIIKRVINGANSFIKINDKLNIK